MQKVKKTKTERLLALALAVVMLVLLTAAPVSAQPASFPDVPSSKWYHPYVMFMAGRDIVGGWGTTGKFLPDNKVIREHAAKMISLSAGLDHEGQQVSFKDNAAINPSLIPYIGALVNEGAIGGFSDNTFRPKENIKRSHACKMVAQAFGLEGGDLEVDLIDLPSSTELKKAIITLASNGIVSGFGDTGQFRPDNEISRAELSKILCVTMAVSAVQKAERTGTADAVAAAQAILNDLPYHHIPETIDALQARLDGLPAKSDEVGILSLKVRGTPAIDDGIVAGVYYLEFEHGIELSSITKEDFDVTPVHAGAVPGQYSTLDNGQTWTFVVTAEDGTTKGYYTVHMSVKEAEEPAVTGLEVKEVPDKTDYLAGEVLDLSGLVVTLSYSNGTSDEVAFLDFSQYGITADPGQGHELAVSDDKVTLTHDLSGESDEFAITVTALEVTGLAVKEVPDKTDYLAGEVLDLSGLVVTLSYNNGTSEEVAFLDFSQYGIAADPGQGHELAVSDDKVILSHDLSGESDEFAITVVQGTIEILAVNLIDDITVDLGTALQHIGLPSEVEVVLSSSSMRMLNIEWDQGTPTYDGETAGDYHFEGSLILPDGFLNPHDLKARVNVIVSDELYYVRMAALAIFDAMDSENSLEDLFDAFDAQGGNLHLDYHTYERMDEVLQREGFLWARELIYSEPESLRSHLASTRDYNELLAFGAFLDRLFVMVSDFYPLMVEIQGFYDGQTLVENFDESYLWSANADLSNLQEQYGDYVYPDGGAFGGWYANQAAGLISRLLDDLTGLLEDARDEFDDTKASLAGVSFISIDGVFYDTEPKDEYYIEIYEDMITLRTGNRYADLGGIIEVSFNGRESVEYPNEGLVFGPLEPGDGNVVEMTAWSGDGEHCKTYTITMNRIERADSKLIESLHFEGCRVYHLNEGPFGENEVLETYLHQTTIWWYPVSGSEDLLVTALFNDNEISLGESLDLDREENHLVLTVSKEGDPEVQVYTFLVRRLFSRKALIESLEVRTDILYEYDPAVLYYYRQTMRKDAALIFSNPYGAVITTHFNGSPYNLGDYEPLELELNHFEIEVESAAGSNSKTYVIEIDRQVSSTATVKDLVIEGVALIEEPQHQETYTYDVYGDNVTLKFDNVYGATIEINGYEYERVVSFTLDSSENIIEFLVTASDGVTTGSFTLILNKRPANEKSSLNVLEISDLFYFNAANQGYLEEIFQLSTKAKEVWFYWEVPDGGRADVLFNDNPVLSMYENFDLLPGDNSLKITVYAAEGPHQTDYEITIVREKQDMALLGWVSFSGIAFDFLVPDQEYTYFAYEEEESHLEYDNPYNVAITVYIDGEALEHPDDWFQIDGKIEIVIHVVSEDGVNENWYYITILPDGGQGRGLTGFGIVDVFDYTEDPDEQLEISTDRRLVQFQIDWDDTAFVEMELNGRPFHYSDVELAELQVGFNELSIWLNNEEGFYFDYEILIWRTRSEEARIENLVVGGTFVETGSLAEYEDPQERIELTALSGGAYLSFLNPFNARILSVTFNSVPYNFTYVELEEGVNTFEIQVQGLAGSATRTYEVVITRQAFSVLDLDDLYLDGTDLYLVFDNAIERYDDLETYSETVGPFNPIAFHNQTFGLWVGGLARDSDEPIALAPGNNSIQLTVTSEDGDSSRSFYFTVNRKLSAIAEIDQMQLEGMELEPGFSPGTHQYTVNTEEGKTRLEFSSLFGAQAQVTFRGAPYTPGGLAMLELGTNVFLITMTPSDGFSPSLVYQITINREESSEAYLSGLGIPDLYPYGEALPRYVFETNRDQVDLWFNYGRGATAQVKLNGQVLDVSMKESYFSGDGLIYCVEAVPLSHDREDHLTIELSSSDGTGEAFYEMVFRRPVTVSPDAVIEDLFLEWFINWEPDPLPSYEFETERSHTSLAFGRPEGVSATVTLNGRSITNWWRPIPLEEGPNKFLINVRVANGASRQYEILINRTLSTRALIHGYWLSGFAEDGEILEPGKTLTVYTDRKETGLWINNVYGAELDMEFEGAPYTEGDQVGLGLGDNVFTIHVQAAAGEAQDTYTLIISRSESSRADIEYIYLDWEADWPYLPDDPAPQHEYETDQDFVYLTFENPFNAQVELEYAGEYMQLDPGYYLFRGLGLGSNQIKIILTSEDLSQGKTLTLKVNRRDVSQDAHIRNLDLGGILFDAEPASFYYLEAETGSTYINFDYPWGSDVSVLFNHDAHGVFWDMNLLPGLNRLEILVTSEDGGANTSCLILINREPEPKAEIRNLYVHALPDSVLIAEVPETGLILYTEQIDAAVDYDNPFLASVSMTLNNQHLRKGWMVPLKLGENDLVIEVVSLDEYQVKTYTITIIRTLSGRAEITGLHIEGLLGYQAVPKLNYTLEADRSVEINYLNPYDARVEIWVEGDYPAYRVEEGEVLYLEQGQHTVKIKVWSADEENDTEYHIHINRIASTRALVEFLIIDHIYYWWMEEELEPNRVYYLDTYSGSTNLQFVNPYFATVTLTVNDQEVTFQEDNSAYFVLVPGPNTITINVVSEAGGQENDYLFVVNWDG